MRTYLPYVVATFLLSATFVFAAPVNSIYRSLIPETTDTYNIGTTSPSLLEYNNIYTKNITVSGTCTGCTTSVFAFPFTTTSYGVSTSTTIGFLSGLFSVGSTTISGLTSGLVGNANGLLYGFASSSLFGYIPLNPTRNINTTYPVQGGGNLSADLTFSLAFGTTTTNTWSAAQLFSYTATTTFSGGIESGTKIAAPYFIATSTTATSTFNGDIVEVGGIATSSNSKQYLARLTSIYATSTPGTNVQIVFTGAKYSAPSFSAGVLTLPSNTSYILVDLWGGGGGGGGTGGDTGNGGVGGTAGQSCFNTSSPACTSPVLTVNGGTGGENGFANNSGGGGGGTGGTASGGTINSKGQGGYVGGTAGPGPGRSGSGGSAPGEYGGTGGGSVANTAGTAGNAPGGGASGGSNSAIAVGGGGGGASGGYTRLLVAQPATTYYYTIGVGGTAGTAGTGSGAQAGGTGASGGLALTIYTY